MEPKPIDWEKLASIIETHRTRKWNLIPLLQEVQETFGYIPPESMEPIAEALNMSPAEVQGVVTFYAGFSLKPKGKCVLKVCRGTACHVKGSRSILRFVQNELGLQEGETSEDYQFTLETVACLGACFLAPTMMVNKNYFGRLNPTKVSSVLNQYGKSKEDDGSP
ncbi:MAG: NADH-quinone oxidoreductase subunit NuoE [Desulfobacterales bacterium CG23_combo_of_CG06-09_8_20_14_all_51_8]|nr:MAG: NADH-quinone oxidoreductase subunit NuoE [Desulfobacterales bacterium CG23_combo_of_CG06-09_8_20_14_all_51_8]